MPEGDTAHRTARRLAQALVGDVLVHTDFRVPRAATSDLAGEEVVASLARGKHLLLRIGAGHTLHTHLAMEGAWHLHRTGGRWRRPAHEARVVLETDRWQAVGFALGVVELVTRDGEAAAVGHLGPDLLGPDWDIETALARLRSTPATAVVTALLDQRNLAGIGNIYACEALFLCGLHPLTPLGDVEGLPRLVHRARDLLVTNLDREVRSTTGSSARGRRTWVHGRAGKPCRRCGTRVEREMLGAAGRERATYWCPRCQPAR